MGFYADAPILSRILRGPANCNLDFTDPAGIVVLDGR